MASIDVIKLATSTGGLVTRAQLVAAGLTAKVIRRCCRDGTIRAVTRDVFILGGLPLDRDRRDRAALLQAGSHAALSHASAARRWTFPRIGAGTPEVVLPHGSPRPVRTLGRVHVSRRLDSGTLVNQAGWPLTALGRTLVDLAPRLTRTHLVDCLHDLRRRELVDVEQLWSSLVGPERRRVPAVGRVAAVVAHLAARPAGESWLEDQFIDLLTAAGIPLPEMQVWIVVDGHRYRVDTCWSPERFVVELDGHEFHSSREDRRRDAERAARLTGAGWRLVVFTYDDVVGRPDYVLDIVGHQLGISRAA